MILIQSRLRLEKAVKKCRTSVQDLIIILSLHQRVFQTFLEFKK